MAISGLLLLQMRNISDKLLDKIQTHIACSITFFSHEILTVYEIMWKNMLGPGRPKMTQYGA
jgi:hypothetical protein